MFFFSVPSSLILYVISIHFHFLSIFWMSKSILFFLFFYICAKHFIVFVRVKISFCISILFVVFFVKRTGPMSATCHVHFRVAPSFRKLTEDSALMTDSLLVSMVVVAAQKLKEYENGNATFDDVVGALNECEELESTGSLEQKQDNKTFTDEEDIFKFDGSASHQKMNEIYAWLTNFVKDKDILESAGITQDCGPNNLLVKSLSETGARIHSFGSFFHGEENVSITVTDVSCLRYPSVGAASISISRLKLVAHRVSKRTLFVESNHSELQASLDTQKWEPNRAWYDAHPEAVEVAAKQLEDLFS